MVIFVFVSISVSAFVSVPVSAFVSISMYDTVNQKVPSYLSDLFSNACETTLISYKSKLRNTECNLALHI